MGIGICFSTTNAERSASMPGFEGRYSEIDGYTMGLESVAEPADFTPMYRGLPDDLCQSHHWGYVIKGGLVMHRPEGDIEISEGEAYYVGPGHTGEITEPGTEIFEVSPTTEYDETMTVLAKNLEAAGH